MYLPYIYMLKKFRTIGGEGGQGPHCSLPQMTSLSLTTSFVEMIQTRCKSGRIFLAVAA